MGISVLPEVVGAEGDGRLELDRTRVEHLRMLRRVRMCGTKRESRKKLSSDQGAEYAKRKNQGGGSDRVRRVRPKTHAVPRRSIPNRDDLVLTSMRPELEALVEKGRCGYKRVTVRDSTIEGAGEGLFAQTKIHRLIRMTSQLIKIHQIQHQYLPYQQTK